MKFFKKLNLYSAPWSRIGFFSDLYSLFDSIFNGKESVEIDPIQHNETGANFLFIERVKNRDKVISAGKVQNLHFEILSEMREVLTKFWLRNK